MKGFKKYPYNLYLDPYIRNYKIAKIGRKDKLTLAKFIKNVSIENVNIIVKKADLAYNKNTKHEFTNHGTLNKNKK